MSTAHELKVYCRCRNDWTMRSEFLTMCCRAGDGLSRGRKLDERWRDDMFRRRVSRTPARAPDLAPRRAPVPLRAAAGGHARAPDRDRVPGAFRGAQPALAVRHCR